MSLITKQNPNASVSGFFNPDKFIIENKKNINIQNQVRPLIDEYLEKKSTFPDLTYNDKKYLTDSQKRNVITEQLRSLFKNEQELNNAIQTLSQLNEIDNFYRFGSVFLTKNKGLRDLTSNIFIELWKEYKNDLLTQKQYKEYYTTPIGPDINEEQINEYLTQIKEYPNYYENPIGPKNINYDEYYNEPIGPEYRHYSPTDKTIDYLVNLNKLARNKNFMEYYNKPIGPEYNLINMVESKIPGHLNPKFNPKYIPKQSPHNEEYPTIEPILTIKEHKAQLKKDIKQFYNNKTPTEDDIQDILYIKTHLNKLSLNQLIDFKKILENGQSGNMIIHLSKEKMMESIKQFNNNKPITKDFVNTYIPNLDKVGQQLSTDEIKYIYNKRI